MTSQHNPPFLLITGAIQNKRAVVVNHKRAMICHRRLRETQLASPDNNATASVLPERLFLFWSGVSDSLLSEYPRGCQI